MNNLQELETNSAPQLSPSTLHNQKRHDKKDYMISLIQLFEYIQLTMTSKIYTDNSTRTIHTRWKFWLNCDIHQYLVITNCS